MGYNTHAFVSLDMLTRTNRLAKRKDFDTLFKRGKIVYGRHLQLRLLKTEANAPLRLAIVISAKTEKSAVRRNRAKRQTREIVRLSMPKLRPGFDGAITIKGSFLPLSHAEKREQTLQLLQKAGLIKS